MVLVLVLSSSRALGVSYWIILTGIACLHFCKEKKHIGFKYLFHLITRNISLLWEGRTVGFHLQGLAFTKSCCLNFSSSGSSCGSSTSTCRTDTATLATMTTGTRCGNTSNTSKPTATSAAPPPPKRRRVEGTVSLDFLL